VTIKIDHQYYNIPGVTDLAVLRKDCEKNRDKRNEVSVLHAHGYFKNEKGNPIGIRCTEECMVYIPGQETRSVKATGVVT